MEVPTYLPRMRIPADKLKKAPKHPGTILQMHYLVPRSISITRLAQLTRIPENILTAIVQGKHHIQKWIAFRLGEALGTTADFWLMLQDNHSNYHRKREKAHADRYIQKKAKELANAEAFAATGKVPKEVINHPGTGKFVAVPAHRKTVPE